MSLPLVYTSSPVYYEPQDSTYSGITQHPELRVPPRVYDESLSAMKGIFVLQTPNVNSPVTYCVVAVLDRYKMPNFKVAVNRFSSRPGIGQGGYLGRDDLGNVAGGGSISSGTQYTTAARNGDIWYAATSNYIRQAVPTSWLWSGIEMVTLDFTPAALWPWAIDRLNDRIIVKASGTGVNIYSIASHSVVAFVETASVVRDVFLEDASRLYCVCDGGLFVLVNYIEAKVLGTFKVDLQPGTMSLKRYAWDSIHKRILECTPTADEADGSSTTIIRGYSARPEVTGITPAIPTQVPRKGRSVRLIARAYGNSGEGIARAAVTATTSGDGSISALVQGADASGYARWILSCDNAGSQTVDLSTETEL